MMSHLPRSHPTSQSIRLNHTTDSDLGTNACVLAKLDVGLNMGVIKEFLSL
jgi:hypothetical protein